jgi:hypothetical protein
MRSFVKLGAAVLALSIAAPALAQTTEPAGQTAPPASSPADPATAGAATAPGATTPAAAPVAVGQPVKDNTGATIGEVAEVKPDASGKQMATIKMGANTFAVDTANLAVRDGATLINATQAEILAMLKK